MCSNTIFWKCRDFYEDQDQDQDHLLLSSRSLETETQSLETTPLRKYITYRNAVGRRPSHGNRQHAEKIGGRVVFEICERTDKQRYTHALQYLALLCVCGGGRSKMSQIVTAAALTAVAADRVSRRRHVTVTVHERRRRLVARHILLVNRHAQSHTREQLVCLSDWVSQVFIVTIICSDVDDHHQPVSPDSCSHFFTPSRRSVLYHFLLSVVTCPLYD